MSIVCEIVKDLVPLHLDGTASKMTESLIRRHLRRCKDCREYYGICTESRDAEIKRIMENAENAENADFSENAQGGGKEVSVPENGYELIARRMEKSIMIERIVFAAAGVAAVAATVVLSNIGKKKKK